MLKEKASVGTNMVAFSLRAPNELFPTKGGLQLLSSHFLRSLQYLYYIIELYTAFKFSQNVHRLFSKLARKEKQLSYFQKLEYVFFCKFTKFLKTLFCCFRYCYDVFR